MKKGNIFLLMKELKNATIVQHDSPERTLIKKYFSEIHKKDPAMMEIQWIERLLENKNELIQFILKHISLQEM
jgi:hypothetical protein